MNARPQQHAAPPRDQGVGLPAGHTGSSFLHAILSEAVERFDELRHAKLPARDAFRRDYGEALVRFEAVRARAARRHEIARFIVSRTQQQLHYGGNGFDGPFDEYMGLAAEPARTTRLRMGGKPGLTPRIPHGEREYTGAAIGELVGRMLERNHMTHAAGEALRWIVERAEQEGGRLDLSGRKFVLMGAAAELAPTPLLLEAGASVLWIDIDAPSDLSSRRDTLAGELTISDEARDILLQPRRIAATIEAFAAGSPVHVGMFAYAPGAGQEWRLAATMNAIVRSLDAELIESVSMFISPTSVAVLEDEDVWAASLRLRKRPAWQSLLGGLGMLRPGGHYTTDGVRIARAVVPIQGVSYQAAQYVSKKLAAETYASWGTRLDAGQPSPTTVSANVAPITKTRSVQHPVFEAAFLGAASVGVEIFEPSTTRAINGLMFLHDLLNPKAPGHAPRTANNLRALFSQQVHGGLYTLPYPVNPTIRVAAMIGLSRKPGLLLRMF